MNKLSVKIVKANINNLAIAFIYLPIYSLPFGLSSWIYLSTAAFQPLSNPLFQINLLMLVSSRYLRDRRLPAKEPRSKTPVLPDICLLLTWLDVYRSLYLWKCDARSP